MRKITPANEALTGNNGGTSTQKKPERNESFSPALLISFKHFQVVVSTFSQIHYNIHSSFFINRQQGLSMLPGPLLLLLRQRRCLYCYSTLSQEEGKDAEPGVVPVCL